MVNKVKLDVSVHVYYIYLIIENWAFKKCIITSNRRKFILIKSNQNNIGRNRQQISKNREELNEYVCPCFQWYQLLANYPYPYVTFLIRISSCSLLLLSLISADFLHMLKLTVQYTPPPPSTRIFKKFSFSIIRIGPYVRMRRMAVFVNVGILELSYSFQTLGDYLFSCFVPCRKPSNSIINTRTHQYVHFKHDKFWLFN